MFFNMSSGLFNSLKNSPKFHNRGQSRSDLGGEHLTIRVTRVIRDSEVKKIASTARSYNKRVTLGFTGFFSDICQYI